MTLRILDSRIRQEHVAKYGLTDDIVGYLRVLENIPAVPDDKDGENHHMLAQSTFPEYANLAANAWNRLRVHRGVHLALTELQARFEDKLRLALNLAKGLSAEAYLDACKRGGAAAGRKAVESGKLAKARTLESCRKGGLRVHELHPDFARNIGKRAYELGVGVHALTHEQNVVNGKIAGKIGGPIGGKLVHKMYPDMARENGKKNGPLQARRQLETKTGIHAPGMAAKGGHIYWHLRRGVVNPKCKFCQQESI